jgi:hypothetical protein
MRRREFFSFIGAAAVAWPLVSRAQVTGIRKVGVLMAGAEGAPENEQTRSQVETSFLLRPGRCGRY